MASVEENPSGDQAAHFRSMARHYEALARREPHQGQSDLFAAIAADYSELADLATGPLPVVGSASPPPADAWTLARWVHIFGRWPWRRPVVPLATPLTCPVTPSGAK